MKYEEFTGKDLESLKNEALTSLNLEEKDCIIKEEEIKGGLFKGTTYKVKVYKLNATKEEHVSFSVPKG